MSSEEPFNYIDHKIKEAAENHQIVFEESSWKKMEALLDKKPGRKRFAWFWLFLPLAIAAGFGIFVWGNKQQKEKIGSASVSIAAENKPPDFISSKTVQKNKIFVNYFNKSTENFNPYKKTKAIFLSKSPFKTDIIIPAAGEENVSENEKTFTVEAKRIITISNSNPLINEKLANDANPTVSTKNLTENDVDKKSKPDSSNIVFKNKKELNKKKSVVSKFYLLGSLGADISSTKLLAFKNNPVSSRYGIGIGYKINKNLSVQTGFYTGKKKYLAKQREYNFKTGSYYNLVRVTKIDAVCMVYEIPVSIRYNVLQKKSLNIYTGVGLSSYIMKKEDYDIYFIKNNTEYSWAYNYTGNQAFLSTFILTVGAEKKLTDKIYLQLEPFVSIPLKGIGEGSVKLFSAALQLGIKYIPF